MAEKEKASYVEIKGKFFLMKEDGSTEILDTIKDVKDFLRDNNLEEIQ